VSEDKNEPARTEAINWTDERVEMLRKLWTDGLSASQIAAEMGGVTRNAVIGKVHRLGLSGRAKPAQPAQRQRRVRPQTPSRPTMPAVRGNTALATQAAPDLRPQAEPLPETLPDNVVPIAQRCSILQLNESTCRWPVGDPSSADFYFCGAKSQTGVPYCAHHARIAYQPVLDRRRDKRVARM
jgi:GcrA cell cycle regulator